MSSEFLTAIEDFGTQTGEFLGVFDASLARVHSLRPFGSGGICAAQSFGNHIYAISRTYGAEDGTPVVLIDAESGEEIARSNSFVWPKKIVHMSQNGMVALVGRQTEIEFRDAETLAHIWTCRPRAIIEPSGGVSLVPNDLPVSGTPKEACSAYDEPSEGPDGLVRMPLNSPNSTGLFEIDPKAGTFRVVSFDPGDQGFNSGFAPISPDGRWGIRERFNLRVEPCEDLESEHGTWFLVTRFFEIWDLPIGRKHADFMAAPEPVLVYTSSLDDVLAYYARLQEDAGNGDSLSPSEPPSKLPLPEHEAPHRARAKLIGRLRFHWEPDSPAVWMVRRYSLMRADLEGTTGPLIFPDVGLGDAQRAALEDRTAGVDLGDGEAFPHGRGCSLIRSVSKPRPDTVRFDFYSAILDLPLPYGPKDAMGSARSYPELTASDIASHLPALVSVDGWTQDAVDTALADLSARITDDLAKLVSGGGLTIVFRLNNSFFDEWSFFEKLRHKNLINTQGLRDLLIAFCDAQGDRNWYFTSDPTRAAGPLSGALAALAQNDDRCHDVLRRYCLLRDGEHENYARDTVLLGFINRMMAKDVETLRLAVFYVLLRDQDGRFSVENGNVVYPWVDLGIPDAARSLMSPEAFAELVQDEVARWAHSAIDTAPVIAGLIEALDPEDQWSAKTQAALRV